MDQTAEKSWQVPNRIDAMTEAARQVFGWLADLPISSRAKYSAGLVVEEMVGNVIKYAYDDDQEHSIRFSIRVLKSDLRLTFEDDGRPFDPTRYPSPNVELLVASSRAGGLGIELVRRACSQMAYERHGHLNRTTLHIRQMEPGDTQRIVLVP